MAETDQSDVKPRFFTTGCVYLVGSLYFLACWWSQDGVHILLASVLLILLASICFWLKFHAKRAGVRDSAGASEDELGGRW